ncbi:hypothetical protein D3C72_1824180 [compost metagenome]
MNCRRIVREVLCHVVLPYCRPVAVETNDVPSKDSQIGFWPCPIWTVRYRQSLGPQTTVGIISQTERDKKLTRNVGWCCKQYGIELSVHWNICI